MKAFFSKLLSFGTKTVVTVATLSADVARAEALIAQIRTDAEAIKAGHSEAITQLTLDLGAVEQLVSDLGKLGQ